MAGTYYHMCMSVRGAIRNKAFGGFTDKSGKPVSKAKVQEFLLDELSKGHEVVPMGECDNFCYKTGCKGHPHKEGE